MSNNELYAYLAGCLDCDGFFTIKRNTYAMRVRGDAGCPIFSEKIGLKQVTPDIPDLLYERFGGYKRIEKSSAKRGKPLYAWSVTDRQAIICVKTLLPYLRIKKEQAILLIELRKLKELPRIKSGTFIMANRWGHHTTIPRRIVDPEVIAQKEVLFNKIKSLNDTRPTKPRLI